MVDSPLLSFYFAVDLTVVFAAPLFDTSNQGHVLAGIVGVEILFRSLFADVTYYGDGRMQYAFAVNAQGRS